MYLDTIRLSPGLLDGATDIIGGDPLQEPVQGDYAVNADGHIIIPASDGGGVVTWVRGVWDLGTTFRYNDFMAGTTDPDAISYLTPEMASPVATVLTGSITGNVLTVTHATTPIGKHHVLLGAGILPCTAITAVLTGSGGVGTYRLNQAHSSPTGSIIIDAVPRAENRLIGGVYSTRLIPDWSVQPAAGTVFHVRFSRRSGETLPKGSSINGWPYNYVDPTYQGTAVDGDMYVMWACEFAYAVTGEMKYHNLAQRIGNANMAAGRWAGNQISFALPFYAEAGQTGLYSYSADTTLFTWEVAQRGDVPGKCLVVEADVPSGGPPYNYAGWGAWPAWKLTADEPFRAFAFEFDGGGCGRNIELSTNVITDDPAGDVGLLVPCFTSTGGSFTPFEYTAADFWRLNNVLWEYRHKAPYWTSESALSAFGVTETAGGIALTYAFEFNLTPVYGANLLVNGDFSTGLTGWTPASYGTGSVTVTGGAAVLSHVSTGRGRLRQGVTVEVGKMYRIEFTCSGFGAAEAFLDLGTTAGGYDIQSNIACGNGLNVVTRTATNAALWLNFFSQTAGVAYAVDDVKVREVVSGGQTAYGDIGIDTAACDSTGTTTLHLDILSNVSGTLRVKITGSPGSLTYTQDLTLTAATRQTHTIAWAAFGAVAHPIQKITLTPLDHGQGQYTLFGAWYDALMTMQDLIDDGLVDVFDGFEFQFPSHPATEPGYRVRFAHILLDIDLIDGTAEDRQRYAGLPRWTYKWAQSDDSYIGYGSWRGWSAPGYLWMGGWTHSDIVNLDNGRRMIDMMRNFMLDAQNEYHARFGHLGPFMPRYGRAAWEALNQEGVIGAAGEFTSNTYNQWYFPWNDALGTGPGVNQSDDWYGYTVRAILSCASDYFLDPTPQVKTVLDRWIAWFNLGEDTQTRPVTKTTDPSGFWTYTDTGAPVRGIVWDSNRWRPPSEYRADGRVRYHYSPVYAWCCIAQALLFKHWVDGDAQALVWMRRLVDYLDTRRITATGAVDLTIRTADDSGPRDVLAAAGSLVIVQRGEEGEGYTSATVTIEGDGTGAHVVPRIFAGRIRYYEITNIGSGYTWIRGTVQGDGAGATVCLALYQQVVGAFDLFHTGWEIWEIYNLYAMLALGRCPGGTVNYPTTPTLSDMDAVTGLEVFFARNTRDEYPMMQIANGLPMHEYGGWDPYHHGSGIENPMIRDSRTRGKLWTETTGPAMRAGVFWRLLHE